MEIVYLGRDGSIDLQLRAEESALTAEQMAAISAIALVYNGQTISSTTSPDVFDWTTRANEAVVLMTLGDQTLLPGTDLAAQLIVYSPDFPNGIVWGTFALQVK